MTAIDSAYLAEQVVFGLDGHREAIFKYFHVVRRTGKYRVVVCA